MITPLVKFVNRRGFPCVESNSINEDGTTTTFVFDNHHLIQSGFSGGFWVRLNQAVSGTNVVQFTITGVSDSTLPLYLSNGSQATLGDVETTGGGVFLCFYDRNANRLQLIA